MSGEVQLTPKQQEAAQCLDEDCIVLAGAGSGKTRVLVQRYLAILEKGELDPAVLDRVVAITFTEKAAAEMKERIRGEAGRRIRLAGEAGDDGKARAWHRILTELERARVTTIHSFCLHILRRYPVEAGLDPQLEVLQEAESQKMLRESVEEAFLRWFSAGGKRSEKEILENWLVDAGWEDAVRQVQDVLSWMFAHGLSVSRLREKTMEDLRRHEEELKGRLVEEVPELYEQLDRSAPELWASSGADGAETFRQGFLWFKAQWNQADDREKPVLLMRLKEAMGIRWGKREARKRCEDAIYGMTEILEAHIRSGEERLLLGALLEVMDEAVREYARRKAARGAVDYDEMQWRVCELLESDHAVRDEIRRGIDHVMVDEFQDTNQLQKRLIDLLIRDDGGKSVLGKLFVVGDPKQSIYRFRGADVSLFHRTHEEIRQSGQGGAIELTDNFRSHPQLIRLYNALFGRLMSGEGTANRYTPARAGLVETPVSHVAEWIEVPAKDERFTGWDSRDLEASLLAVRIGEMIRNEGIRPGEIAILFRTMTHVKKYERELARAGIPYYVVKGRGFYDRQEVRDVIHFLRLLVRPDDRQAMAGVLRSPFCGVSDGTITRIALEKNWSGTPSQWAELEGMPEEERRKLIHFGQLLEMAGRIGGTVRIGELLERILEESGYLISVWSVPEGKQVAANLRKLIDQAETAAGLPAWSVAHYLDWLEFLAEQQERETEAAVESEDSDCVRLMSIHQAKGLEFPVVFVPDLSRDQGVTQPSLFVCEDAGLVARLRDGSGEKAYSPERYKQAEKRAERLERDESARLLYVAMTRAEKRLVLSGVKEAGKPRNPESRKVKWTDWLFACLGENGLSAGNKEWRFAEDALPIHVAAHLEPDLSAGDWEPTRLDALIAGEDPFKAIGPSASAGQTPMFPPRGFTENDLLEMSVTEWKELMNCPRRYFYRRVAAVPVLEDGADVQASTDRRTVLAPNVRGTTVHRVIELLTGSGENRSWEEWAERALDELDIAPEDRLPALLEIRPFISNFLKSRICPRLSEGAAMKAEQRFVLEIPGLRMIGVIDCLMEREDGSWEIIDYKTDHVGPDELEAAAREYLPQLMMYALAAVRQFGIRPVRASLLFLHVGREWSVEVEEEWLERAETALQDTVRQLRGPADPSHWEARQGKRCSYCGWNWMCESAVSGEDDKSTPVELS